MGKFDEADLQKAYAWAQGKYDETVTIANRSRQIGTKLQARTKTVPPSGVNIVTAEDPYITSVLTQEYVEDEDISLLDRASLALDSAGDNISPLGEVTSFIGNYVYLTEDMSLGASAATGHTIASKVKQATYLLTQKFMTPLKNKEKPMYQH